MKDSLFHHHFFNFFTLIFPPLFFPDLFCFAVFVFIIFVLFTILALNLHLRRSSVFFPTVSTSLGHVSVKDFSFHQHVSFYLSSCSICFSGFLVFPVSLDFIVHSYVFSLLVHVTWFYCCNDYMFLFLSYFIFLFISNVLVVFLSNVLHYVCVTMLYFSLVYILCLCWYSCFVFLLRLFLYFSSVASYDCY